MSSVLPTTIDLTDPRTRRAIAIAADAGQWLKCRVAPDGRKAYGIKASRGGAYYLTTRTSCTCPDQQFSPWRDCKHITAVNIFCLLAAPA